MRVGRRGPRRRCGIQRNGSIWSGLYSISAAGGPLQRIVNYNVTLPNEGTAGTPGHSFCNFGLTDGSTVAFAAFTAGNAADGTALSQSVYTASINGANLAIVADGDHMFYDPSQPRVWYANCVEPYATTAAAYGPAVVFAAGSEGSLNSIYAQTIGTPAQGTSDVPPDYSCALTGGAGPVVTNSLTALPGDPAAGRQLPQYAYFQTDGTSVYFLGYDWNYPCCAGPSGWSGLFSVPLPGGVVTKIAAVGDTLPVIGAALSFGSEFSADAGGLVFTAQNAGGSGIFLYNGGSISKVVATGDPLNNGIVGTSDTFEVYPQSYKAGKIAFMWKAGVYVAAPNCAQDVSGSVTVTPHGFLYNRSTGQFVQQVTVTNHSASSIGGPMQLFIESLTSDAALANASGVSSCFAPRQPLHRVAGCGRLAGPRRERHRYADLPRSQPGRHRLSNSGRRRLGDAMTAKGSYPGTGCRVFRRTGASPGWRFAEPPKPGSSRNPYARILLIANELVAVPRNRPLHPTQL